MRKVISSGRLASLAVLMLVLLVLYLTRLYRLQVIEGEQAYEASTNSIVSYETVAAARGNLLDRYGRLLVSNRNCNNLVIDEDELFIDNDNERINADILELCRLITEHGDGYNDELPISMTAPFEFKESLSDIETELLQAWLAANGLKSDASAVEVMAKMRTRYGIDNNYSAEDMRIIAGVRYSINVRYVINTSDYTFAQDVSIETITALMESNIGGVDVTVSYIREYNTQYAAHILGYTGLMTDADYEKYKELGYSFNASVGKDGAELAFESYLHGRDGTAAVTRTSEGVVTSTVYVDGSGNESEPQPGNHVYLTIDIELQAMAEQVLANYIAEENAQREEDNLLYAVYGKEKKDLITGGAIVAVDCRTGEPLCMASYPTFTLETMLDDYAELNRDENRPLFNRCLLGTYSPGSTFKLCTALAGLCEGKVYLGEEIDCTGQFTLYETAGYAPYCWNIYGHGPMDLVNGILNSCNVFFWTVGDRLGNELIYDYATRLGMGQRTGIELPEYKGYVATPEVKAEIFKGTEDAGWYSGDTLQLAIGQSVTQITPLQIARYVAAIANSGTVYNCSILKSAVSYDYARTIYEREPDIYGEIEADAEIWDAIHEGMYGVTHSPAGSGYSAFNGYTVEVAGKTGTTQNVGTNDGLFVCYAPFDDPEIAVAVVLENGGAGAEVAEMARQVLEYYFSFRDSTAQLEQEMTLLH